MLLSNSPRPDPAYRGTFGNSVFTELANTMKYEGGGGRGLI